MDVMALRCELLQPHILTIGGIYVWQNNVGFQFKNGKINALDVNDALFISEVIDTGSTSKKKYTFLRHGLGSTIPYYLGMRFFNDLSATSVDYWSTCVTESESFVKDVTIDSYGRYIVTTIPKKYADIFYLRYTNGEYLIRGKNVT